MFRNILKSNYLVVTTRNFCEKRLPTIVWSENMMSEDNEAKIKETGTIRISRKLTNFSGDSFLYAKNLVSNLAMTKQNVENKGKIMIRL